MSGVSSGSPIPRKWRDLPGSAFSGREDFFQSAKFRVDARRPTIPCTSNYADALPFFYEGSCQMAPKRTLNARARSTPEEHDKPSASLEARGITRHGER